MSKLTTPVVGILLSQDDLDTFDLMIQELPWKYANPLLQYLQSKVKEGGLFRRVDPKTLNKNTKAFTFKKDDDYFDPLNVLDTKIKEDDISISRTQQPIQNY